MTTTTTTTNVSIQRIMVMAQRFNAVLLQDIRWQLIAWSECRTHILTSAFLLLNLLGNMNSID